MTDTQMVIFGAGIAGLTAAIALNQQGVKVRVLEKQAAASTAGAGIVIDPAAQALLGKLGVSLHNSYSANSFALAEARSKRLLARQKADLLLMHRAELHQALLAKSEHLVEYGQHWQSLEDVGDSVRWYQNGGTHTAKLAIGADGLRSIVRSRTCGRCKARFSGQVAWRGVAHNSLGIHAPIEYWHHDKTRLGLVPLTDNRLYWYFTDVNNVDIPVLSKVWRNIVPNLEAWLPGALRHELWALPSRCAGNNRIGLIGDAGQGMTPNLGKGGCQAIADGVALANAVAEYGLVPEALWRYDAARRSESNRIISMSNLVGKVATANRYVVPVRNSLMKLAATLT
ncbi:FAD-dependent monooxygenase [Salinibius halmophilus]|uniref:FAD-dependent monooxygenase n=1 Tax=Salinibius halmophilus TaxID=1853216 RepID=UPI000E6604F8|nr:FAD-dependent monooxygenase [Salinibius halmophilus]